VLARFELDRFWVARGAVSAPTYRRAVFCDGRVVTAATRRAKTNGATEATMLADGQMIP
jgi:hypothetical protein